MTDKEKFLQILQAGLSLHQFPVLPSASAMKIMSAACNIPDAAFVDKPLRKMALDFYHYTTFFNELPEWYNNEWLGEDQW